MGHLRRPQRPQRPQRRGAWGKNPTYPHKGGGGRVTALRVLQEAHQHIFTFSLPNRLAFRIVAGVSGFWDYDRLGTSLYVDSLHVFDGDMNQSASRQFRL